MVRIVGFGLIQNEHGVWCVRRKVPKRLEEAVARAMGAPKARVSWLKESLRTKDEGQAKILSKPVMMKFDRILAEAEGAACRAARSHFPHRRGNQADQRLLLRLRALRRRRIAH
jgi:hypothetical protein